MLRPYKRKNRGLRQRCGWDEIGIDGRERRRDEIWDLGFVGVADYDGDAGEGGEFFRGARGVAAGDDDFGDGVGGVEFADGVASLSVGGGGDSAGVEDDDVGGGCRRGRGTAAVEELAFDGGAVGLGGAAAELLDVEGGHDGGSLQPPVYSSQRRVAARLGEAELEGRLEFGAGLFQQRLGIHATPFFVSADNKGHGNDIS